MSDTTFEWNDLLACEFAGFLEQRLKYNSPLDIPSILYLFKENKRLEKKWESEELDKNSEQRPWQILSFRGAHEYNKENRWEVISTGAYEHVTKSVNTYSLYEMLLGIGWNVENGDILIESVKRNSDGGVFTVGETFLADAGCDLTIDKFIVSDNGELHVKSKEYGYWPLNKIRHKPKPLFTTTDGVDVFPGMPYWSVDPDFEPFYQAVADDSSGKEPGRKYFSTQEAAIQFTWDNKPIWSRKDFREIIRVLEEKITLKTPE